MKYLLYAFIVFIFIGPLYFYDLFNYIWIAAGLLFVVFLIFFHATEGRRSKKRLEELRQLKNKQKSP